MDAQLEYNKNLVRRYYEINTHGSQGIEEVVTDNFVDHHFPPTLPPWSRRGEAVLQQRPWLGLQRYVHRSR